MTVRTLIGDCREILPTLGAESVDCIVTSPPYFGLRDYGVAGQIGLEPTLDAYVETMAQVGRDLWRVLKPSGTFWLNLGSSFASSPNPNAVFCGKNSNQSHQRKRAPAYDTDGKELRYSEATDSACYGPYGEPQGDVLSRRARIARNGLPLDKLPWRDAPTGQHSALRDSELRDELSRLSPKALSFFGYAPGAFDLEATASAFQQQQLICSRDAQHLVSGTCDTVQNGSTSGARRTGKEFLGSACRNPDCRGYCSTCLIDLGIKRLPYKAKDLLLVPELVALALQADGWYIRQRIIWAKANPLPESVRDRPTSAHEHVWMLTKAATYWYDADAIAEPFAMAEGGRTIGRGEHGSSTARALGGQADQSNIGGFTRTKDARNARNVWQISSQPFPGSHHAVMPPALAERCIKAGCPERVCVECGEPWVRGRVRTDEIDASAKGSRFDSGKTGGRTGGDRTQAGERFRCVPGELEPACSCGADWSPGVTLDPFGGSGTTGLVADRLGRNALLIELNPAYVDLQRDRITGDAPLFAEFVA